MNAQVEHLRTLAAYLVLVLVCGVANAGVVIPIKAPEKALFASGDPTMTLLLEAEKPATKTVLFIPGGNGHYGLREGPMEVRTPFSLGIFIPLTKASINVVIIDNPRPIDERSGAPGSDRIDRIETVVKFYQAKFRTPIWLFGHSNGTAAVMEFINRSDENRQLIAGVVLSASRQEYKIDSDVEVKFPVLILHHRNDGCRTTPYASAVKRFDAFKERNISVEFVTIEGGEGGGEPCQAGYHMYNKAYQEVVNALLGSVAK